MFVPFWIIWMVLFALVVCSCRSSCTGRSAGVPNFTASEAAAHKRKWDQIKARDNKRIARLSTRWVGMDGVEVMAIR